MRRIDSLLMVVIAVALLASSVSATYPQSPDPQPPGENCRLFAETGYYVCDEFLEFFDTRGGLEIFGYPITDAFEDPELGLLVQYFQRARMEWHPYNKDPYKVQLGLLIDELGYNFPRASNPSSSNGPFRYYFDETGHFVSYAFLDYFRKHGDLDIFGYPRSEFMYEDGCIVQYFQRARMEWHPDAPPGLQMRLSNVGEEYVKRFGIEASTRPNMDLLITELDVSASVRHIITGREGTQTVFVYVTDQRQRPVKGAAVSMVVHYQSGDQRYDFQPTNASGFTSYSFEIRAALPGQKVVIDVTVTYGGLTATTQTFFLPWW